MKIFTIPLHDSVTIIDLVKYSVNSDHKDHFMVKSMSIELYSQETPIL